MLRAGLLLIAVLLAALLYLVADLRSQLRGQERKVLYRAADEAIVAKAFQLDAADEGTSVAKLKTSAYAVVVHFPDMRCVDLKRFKGWASTTKIYCFQRESDAFIRNYNGLQ